MPKEPAHIRALRAYAQTDLNFDELIAIEKELYGLSDRASAVILAAMAEGALRQLLFSKMRAGLNSDDRKQLFGFDGVAGTFAGKITLAYALELIGPVSRADLDLIRFLRNNFAHSRKPMNFDVPQVQAVCAKLQFPDFPESVMPWGPIYRVPGPGEGDRSDARTRYRLSCHNLTIRLIYFSSPPTESEAAKGLFAHFSLP